MGQGTSSGVQTPSQPGVIVGERKNFPRIPQFLLMLSQEELMTRRDGLWGKLQAKIRFPVPDEVVIRKLEDIIFVYDAAREAVRRQQESSVVR